MQPRGLNNVADDIDAESTAHGRKCRLLALPAELRNRIYHLALVQDACIEERFSKTDQRIPAATQPALTRVNRTIRSDTLPIFYGNYTFRLRIPLHKPLMICRKWLKVIEKHFTLIQRWEICCCTHDNFFVVEKADKGAQYKLSRLFAGPPSQLRVRQVCAVRDGRITEKVLEGKVEAVGMAVSNVETGVSEFLELLQVLRTV